MKDSYKITYVLLFLIKKPKKTTHTLAGMSEMINEQLYEGFGDDTGEI